MQCPKCKKQALKFIPWVGWMYECTNCGYRGPIALEKKEIKKSRLPKI